MHLEPGARRGTSFGGACRSDQVGHGRIRATRGGVAALAQSEQFIPILSYRVGPYAAGGSGYFGGAIDYFNLVNMTGGINGVKLIWEECETEYNASRGVECYERLKKKNGGASMVEPLSTGIAYGLLDRVAQDKIPMTTFGYGSAKAADGRVFEWVFPIGTSYWSQAAAMIAYLRRRRAASTSSRARRSSTSTTTPRSARSRSRSSTPSREARLRAHQDRGRASGQHAESQWLQIRQAKPDYVILWGWGVMNPTALKAAAKIGFRAEDARRVVGRLRRGRDPGRRCRQGLRHRGLQRAGHELPGDAGHRRRKSTAPNKGNLEDKSRQGSIYHTRGVAYGIIAVEAIRKAQEKFGKGKVMTGEQIRWGLGTSTVRSADQGAGRPRHDAADQDELPGS